MAKMAHRSNFIGQQGVNLIASIVAEMGHLWTPTTAHSDVGIDGYIELCEEINEKREATNKIIQVQSKATESAWSNETDDGFTFRVEKGDLDHWLNATN